MNRPTDRFRYEYQVQSELPMGYAKDATVEDFSKQSFETVTYEGVEGESRRIHGRILEAIDEAKQDNPKLPGVLVLGVEDYVAVDAWVRYESGNTRGIDSEIPLEIVTVPGRMIHVPTDNQNALLEELQR